MFHLLASTVRLQFFHSVFVGEGRFSQLMINQVFIFLKYVDHNVSLFAAPVLINGITKRALFFQKYVEVHLFDKSIACWTASLKTSITFHLSIAPFSTVDLQKFLINPSWAKQLHSGLSTIISTYFIPYTWSIADFIISLLKYLSLLLHVDIHIPVIIFAAPPQTKPVASFTLFFVSELTVLTLTKS